MKTPCENLAGRMRREGQEQEDPRVTAARLELRAFVGEMTRLIEKKIDALADRIARNDKNCRERFEFTELLDAINRAVAVEFSIEPDLLYSPRRTVRVVVPRQTAMYLARRLTGATMNQIGDHFGGMDHGTVRWAVRCTEDRMAAYPDFRRSVERLQALLEKQMAPLDPIRALGLTQESEA